MPHIVHTERTEPRRKLIRTDGALYVLLLLGAFGAILLTFVLSNRFGINKLYLQIGLYAVLLGAGYWIYRTRLVDYLYELYDTELKVSQIVGSKQKLLLTVPLTDISEVGSFHKTDAKPESRSFHGAREKTTAVWFIRDGERRVLCMNASDALIKKLSEAVHAED